MQTLTDFRPFIVRNKPNSICKGILIYVDMKSPLLKLKCLLRVYSYIGVFPASVGPSSVRGEVWRLLPMVAVGLAYFLYTASAFQWSKSELCLARNTKWDWWTQLSTMGEVSCEILIPFYMFNQLQNTFSRYCAIFFIKWPSHNILHCLCLCSVQKL